ncbi:MAG: ATP-binding cassette domain-containing protein [Defluviitaleaceae bacterium]|nr:ATP-binding cassette domain-containing protein [Defluviitaleaceae bacterium]
MTPIVLNNIHKSYGTPPKPVLENISLTLHPGITCLMGPSGIGKTTLANIAAGLLSPDGGTVTGREGKKIAFLFQEDRLLEWETALSNVLFVTPNAKEFTAQARTLLTRAGLADAVNQKTAELSGGMKRRVALCRTLITDRDFLILDEPFKGLDDETKPAIIEMVKSHISLENPKIILCITHDHAEAEALSGQLIRM